MANILDPDQDQHSIGPDLGSNCLQRLSADDSSRQRLKFLYASFVLFQVYSDRNEVLAKVFALISARDENIPKKSRKGYACFNSLYAWHAWVQRGGPDAYCKITKP